MRIQSSTYVPVSTGFTGQVRGTYPVPQAPRVSAQPASPVWTIPASPTMPSNTAAQARATLAQVRSRAELALAVYDPTKSVAGWTRLPEIPGHSLNTPLTGFKAGVFQRGNEIVVSFAGTDTKGFTLAPDAVTDIAQGFGVIPPQYLQAAGLVRQVKAHYGDNYRISLTGHSLGGGLATFAGLSEGLQTTAFNGAGLGFGARAALWATGDLKRNESKITNINVKDELLSSRALIQPPLITPTQIGETFEVPGRVPVAEWHMPDTLNPFTFVGDLAGQAWDRVSNRGSNHSMDKLVEQLNQPGVTLTRVSGPDTNSIEEATGTSSWMDTFSDAADWLGKGVEAVASALPLGRPGGGFHISRLSLYGALKQGADSLGRLSTGFGIASLFNSDSKVRDAATLAITTAVEDATSASAAAYIAASRPVLDAGTTLSKVGGFTAAAGMGMANAAAAAKVIEGIADTPTSIWAEGASLNEMLRANAQYNQEQFSEEWKSSDWLGKITLPVTSTFHAIGSDIKAVGSWAWDGITSLFD